MNWFDETCENISRRELMKGAFFATIGSALITLLPANSAAACFCRGQEYNSNENCCLPSGLRPRYPMDNNILQYKDMSPWPHFPGCVPTNPPCGSQDGISFPSSIFSGNFGPCCTKHDCDYNECEHNRVAVDNAFAICTRRACPPAGGTINGRTMRQLCLAAAAGYAAAVRQLGDGAYLQSKLEACQGCGSPQCGAGITCANPGGQGTNCQQGYPICHQRPGDVFQHCRCQMTVSGAGACVESDPCLPAKLDCTSDEHCSEKGFPGYVCLAASCCEGKRLCARPCTFTETKPTRFNAPQGENAKTNGAIQ